MLSFIDHGISEALNSMFATDDFCGLKLGWNLRTTLKSFLPERMLNNK